MSQDSAVDNEDTTSLDLSIQEELFFKLSCTLPAPQFQDYTFEDFDDSDDNLRRLQEQDEFDDEAFIEGIENEVSRGLYDFVNSNMKYCEDSYLLEDGSSKWSLLRTEYYWTMEYVDLSEDEDTISVKSAYITLDFVSS